MKRFHGWHAALGLVALAGVVADVRPVSAFAPPGHFTVLGDGTVMDNKTGLTWQQASLPQTYTWSNANSSCVNNDPGLNGGSWRLPTMKELQTLVDETSTASPPMDPTAFPAVTQGAYWTSSAWAAAINQHWYVSFGVGDAASNGDNALYYARCVY